MICVDATKLSIDTCMVAINNGYYILAWFIRVSPKKSRQSSLYIIQIAHPNLRNLIE